MMKFFGKWNDCCFCCYCPASAAARYQNNSEDKRLWILRWFPWSLFFSLQFCYTCRSREMKQKLNQRSAWKLKAQEMNWEWFGQRGAHSLDDVGQLRRSIITCHMNILRNILIKRTLKIYFWSSNEEAFHFIFTCTAQQRRVTNIANLSLADIRLVTTWRQTNVAGRQLLIAMRLDF